MLGILTAAVLLSGDLPTLLTWLAQHALSHTLALCSLLQRVAVSTLCINKCNCPKMALCVAPTIICPCHWKAFLLKDWAVVAETWLCSRHREELVCVSATHLI